jgi:hypothetical protein
VNDDPNVEPVDMTELSPTRAELIARVRARGRQIRARRRLAITGLTALVVLAIAAPAIAIGARSSSHVVTPATVLHRKRDFRVALVEQASSDTSFTEVSCAKYYFEKMCLGLGRDIVGATDVRSDSVVYDDTQSWIVNVEITPAAARRLAARANHQVAIIVNGRVVSTPMILSGVTRTTITVAAKLTRDRAIALATEITGRPPSHVAAAPPPVSTRIELPGTAFVAGTDVHGSLVIDNETGKTMTLEPVGACHYKWAVSLTNAETPLSVVFTRECGSHRTVLQPGENRFPVTVPTTYTVCTGAGGVGGAGEVHCLPDGSIPPLPPGDYQVVLSTDPQGILPTPAAVTAHVTAAGSAKP